MFGLALPAAEPFLLSVLPGLDRLAVDMFQTQGLPRALAIGLPILLVWLLAFTRLWNFEGALEATVSWPFLIAGLLLFVAIFLRSGRRREG